MTSDGTARVVIGVCRPIMAACRQLVRLVIAHKKLLVSITAVFVIVLYADYGLYSAHSSRISGAGGNSLKSVLGGWWIGSWSMLAQLGDRQNSSVSLQSGDEPLEVAEGKVTIAIGGGITSKGSKLHAATEKFTEAAMLDLEFFKTLLPSFCRTAGSASDRYIYRFYMGYDRDDPLFIDRHGASAFRQAFVSRTDQLCGPRSVKASLRLVACRHSGRPAWAQNDAMLDAYLDGVEYFYRVNDDTRMTTGGWTDLFVATLEKYDPPHVGVVGPKHSGGNLGILTYDFVHRTHVDIFGFYYPRVFGDWYGDGWITRVYQPRRSTKLQAVRLAHTMSLGRRYKLTSGTEAKVEPRLIHDKKVLARYIAAVRAAVNKTASSTSSLSSLTAGVSSGRRLIVLSLNSSEPQMTWGAIRNAQLIAVHLPGWRLRVYVPSGDESSDRTSSASLKSSTTTPTISRVIRPRIVATLRRLGAEVVPVATRDGVLRHPPLSALLTDLDADYVLMRRAEWRLSEREAAAVLDWIHAAESKGPEMAIVHCLHDHEEHAERALISGLWGFRPAALRRRMITNQTMTAINQLDNDDSYSDDSMLDRVIWPLTADTAYCHDSVKTCHDGLPAGNSSPFPVERLRGDSFVGQTFDENQNPVEDDSKRTRPLSCSNAYSGLR